jgi:hypothetical protein
MKKEQTRRIAILFLVCLTLGVAGGAVQDQEKASEPEKAKPVKEKFSGRLVLWAAGPLTGQTTRLTMQVDHWMTDEEKQALYATLKEGGSDALLAAMRKNIVGYIWTTQSLRYKLNIASTFQTEKGRTVRLVTERPITFAEQMAGAPRSRDYEFGVIEFTLNEKNQGEGVIFPTAKVGVDEKGSLTVESLGTGPQKLMNVKKDK